MQGKQRCYMCDDDHADYPYKGKCFCANCTATLMSLSKANGIPIDSLIEYFEPHRKEIAENRKIWQETMDIVNQCKEYVYDDTIYDDTIWDS